MIKTMRTPKFTRKNEAIKVQIDGSTIELTEEYAAVTQCIAKVFVNSCIPGKLEELKRELYAEMIRFIDESFTEAEKSERRIGRSMAQFVELENGNLLSTSCITLIIPHAGIKYDSEKIKVHAAIRVKWDNEVAELISATAVAPWPNPDNEVEPYNLLCDEGNRLERAICDFFPDIIRGIFEYLMIYNPPNWIRRQLRKAAENTAERITEEVKKMEE